MPASNPQPESNPPWTFAEKASTVAACVGGVLLLSTIPSDIAVWNHSHDIARLKVVANQEANDHIAIAALRKQVKILTDHVIGIRGFVVRVNEAPDVKRCSVLVAPGHGQAAVKIYCNRRNFHPRKGDWVVAHFDSDMREFKITKLVPMRHQKIIKGSHKQRLSRSF